MKNVVIIGGGISGLSAAYRLKELSEGKKVPLKITLLEGGKRLGGVIETSSEQGCLLEGGPDSFITEKPWALQLCQRIGLETELLPTRPEMRRSFILQQGKLHQVPEGFYLLAPARVSTLLETPFLSWSGKFRMAMEPFIPAGDTSRDVSVADFVLKRFGREALERIAQPMIGGIYTADPEKLSLNATFPRFQEMVREHGSVMRGLFRQAQKKSASVQQASGPRYSLFLSLRGGMGTLISRLREKMPEVEFKTDAPVKKILKKDEGWQVQLEKEILSADAVCLAVRSYEAASLLEGTADLLSHQLAKISYESAATVNLAFRREDILHPLNGFGFVVPSIEKRPFVGCTFVNVKFEGRTPDGLALLRVFIGGAANREIFEMDDESLEKAVLEQLKGILGITARPEFVSIKRHPRAMPQYEVGHLDRVRELEEETEKHAGIFLAGNAFHGVGIPDCIRRSEKIAEKMITYLN